jgi:hypothetical protein
MKLAHQEGVQDLTLTVCSNLLQGQTKIPFGY